MTTSDKSDKTASDILLVTKWDLRWLSMARFVSNWSKDPRTKCGAIIARGKDFIALGYNGFPDCIEDKEEWLEDREIKLKLVTHCEINAFNSTKDDLVGCTLYTYPFPPCGVCAKFIASKGIKRVVAGPEDRYINEALFVFNKAEPKIELVIVEKF